MAVAELEIKPKSKAAHHQGARQVGKTTLIKAFARRYKHAILLNLEKPGDRRFFDDFDNVQTIFEALFLAHNIPSVAIAETLLFVDEIQESPKAIHLLRYFYEELPQLHVVSAESLLEFALQKVKVFLWQGRVFIPSSAEFPGVPAGCTDGSVMETPDGCSPKAGCTSVTNGRFSSVCHYRWHARSGEN
ncbi:AAA family ATPase [Pedobacter yulinensis]|uniref:AAA family ATPase n=1 Tax=Pedobacter yulinensis TaxID=2126353 RepID=UPI0037442EBD